MATRRTKNADNERLDDASIERVITLLEPKDGTKPGTKKDACAILGIAYNTTRLASLLEKYKERKEADAARRAEKRGKPATTAEIQFVVTSYLEGATVDHISTSLYRSASFVKAILEKYHVPIRQTGHSYFSPGLVPDEAMRAEFKVGDKVYSMRYDSLARVDGEFSKGVYRLFLLSEKQNQFAYQPAEELASLKHLEEIGVKF